MGLRSFLPWSLWPIFPWLTICQAWSNRNILSMCATIVLLLSLDLYSGILFLHDVAESCELQLIDDAISRHWYYLNNTQPCWKEALNLFPRAKFAKLYAFNNDMQKLQYTTVDNCSLVHILQMAGIAFTSSSLASQHGIATKHRIISTRYGA